MGLHYLTFMGRNLRDRKKLMLVQMMNSVNMNTKNSVNSVSMVNDSDSINSIFSE